MTDGRHGRKARFLLIACAFALLFSVPVIVSLGDFSAPVRARMVGAAEPTPAVPVAPTPAPAPAPKIGSARDAVAAAEAAADPRTELAVAVLDRTTGEVAVGKRGNEPYYTASLSKLIVAVDMMDRRRFDGLTITDNDIALLRRALGPSDDSAMNALWSRFDGEGAAARVRARLDLATVKAPSNPSQWGQMSVSAIDFARIWQYVLDSLPPADRDLLVSAMDAAPDKAKDGFNQAFGLMSPAVNGPDGPGAVAKQGWMCCFSGQYYLHSSGAVGADNRYLMVLLTREPRGPGWDAARKGLTEIATVAVRALA